MAHKSALEEYLAIEAQAREVKKRAIAELEQEKATLLERVSEIDAKLAELSGTPTQSTPESTERTRTSITIEQVVAEIRKGATNYRAIANALGCVPATVKAKVDAEGKHAGITSSGKKGSFKLHVK